MSKSAKKAKSFKVAGILLPLMAVSGLSNAYTEAGADACANNGLQNTRIGIGNNAAACADGAIAIGQGSEASATRLTTPPTPALPEQPGVAIGRFSYASGGVAMGDGAKAGGPNADGTFRIATAIGAGAIADGHRSIAIGTARNHNTVASGTSAVAIGSDGTASGNRATALGVDTIASGLASVALGAASNSTADSALALGDNASASKVYAVALGANSTTATNATKVESATINGLTYTYAGAAKLTGSQVSVGSAGAERQIKNVASGTVNASSTDAINGSQLYVTNNALGNVANTTKNIFGGNAALGADGNITMTNIGNTGKNTINNAILASQEEVVAGTNIKNVVKNTGANGQDIYTVNANGTTASAGSSAVTVKAGTPNANNITDYAVDLSQTTKDSLVKADTALQSVVTQINGVDVKTINKGNNTANFVRGDNIALTANADGSITVGTIKDVKFDNINVTNNLTVAGDTKLGDSFTVNKGGSYYSGPITEGNHITNKTYVDGKVRELAETPLTFTANTGSVSKKLGETVIIKGTGAKADNAYSADNVKTLVDADGNLVVTLDKNLSVESVTLSGLDGKDGINLTGAAGAPGLNGTDGVTRIIYTDPTTGEQEQVATLNDGLKFGGNTGDVIAKKLNEQLDITGELAADKEATGANLRVDSKNGKLNLVMSKDLTDLNSVTVGDTIINGDSITTTNLNVAGDTKLGDSFTVNKGGSYYSGPITEGDHITNKTYVDGKVGVLADTPLTFAVNTGSVAKKLGETVTIKGTGAKADTEYSADNVKTLVDADGNLVVALDKNLSADSVTLNGQNGKDGISLTGAAGASGLNGTNGVTRIIYTDPTTGKQEQVATLNDGLKFGGNTGDVIAKKLNEQLDITGELAADKEATGANLRVDSKNGKLNLVMSKDLTDLNSVTVGDTIINGDSITTTNLNVAGDTKLGDSFTVNKGGSYYSGPITEGDHITNKTYVDRTGAASKTEVGQGKNIQVSSTIGADGQSIYTIATADDVDFNKVTVGDTTITSDGLVIANGPSITKNGISAGDQKITDVADGIISADSEDAINGSQLYGLGSNVTQLFGGNALYVNNQISWSNIGGTGQNNIDDAIKYVNDQAENANQGWKVTTDSGSNATSTVKPSDTVNINGDTGSGVTVTNTGNNITVGLSDKIQVGSGNNGVSIDGNAGTIEVGDVYIDGSKGTITAGQVTVNGEAGTVNGLSNTTWDPNNIVSGQAATEDQLKQVAQNATQAATAAKSTVTAGDNIAVSTSKNADGSTNYQVATQKDVTFDTVKSGSVTSDKVTVGNVVIDQAGINAGGNKVTNVVNGTISSTSTDAINGSQLHSSNTNIYNYLGGGADYETNTGPTYNVGGGSHNNVGDALNSLDQSVTNVSNRLEQAFYTTNKRIDDVENRANAGNAQALATAGLPQAYIPGKSMMAISGGTFRRESGYAIGMSSISDNGRWVFKVSGSGNSRGDFGGTVGTGIQW